MPVFEYGGLYLGLMSILDEMTDLVHCELAYSHDTVAWHRICPGHDLIPLGPEGSCDCGCIYAGVSPVISDDEIKFYYAGSNGPHTTWRNSFLCLARLGKDRFAGYQTVPDNQTGTLTTVPLAYGAGNLTITADVEQGGCVEVSALDSTGKALARSEPIVTDTTDGVVQWESQTNMSTLEGTQVRLQFELTSATLYAFGLRLSQDNHSKQEGYKGL